MRKVLSILMMLALLVTFSPSPQAAWGAARNHPAAKQRAAKQKVAGKKKPGRKHHKHRKHRHKGHGGGQKKAAAGAPAR